MANYNSGVVNVGTPGSQTALSLAKGSRRLYDFSDRVAELSPEESPFFVYLSKVGKVPTSDPQFRFLEDRTKMAFTDRSFNISTDLAAVSVGAEVSATITAAAPWLIKGMVISVTSFTGNSGGPNHANAIITKINSTTSINIKWLTNPGTDADPASFSTEAAQLGQATVIGTAFAEGTGAPDVWSQELDHDYGYTQIFKTACEMSNTARATVYKGYADEWQRIWNLKLREHKIDIERAMLFGQRASSGGVNYTEGIVGHILANGQSQTIADGNQLVYTEGQAYLKTVAAASLTYDVLLRDLEVVFDPARGGNSSKLALCSLPVISLFNKLGDGAGFIGDTFTGSSNNTRYNFSASNGSFGHKVMKVETVHGDLSLVKEPLFRKGSGEFMCMVDLDHVSYRPLVGNGVNRDTSITTNVQQADEDLRKDLILTEAGLEVSLPETHALFNFEEAL
tara:strand:+ start:1019 stop:2374 length:1356 start_codon:yes stop_codon:yes gene_type:complete